MANIRVTALPRATGLADDDVLHGVQDNDGRDKSVHLDDLATYVNAQADPVMAVTGAAPITSTGGNNPEIGITEATDTAAGAMSAADKAKLDGIEDNANAYVLPVATDVELGGVMIGENIQINNGVISVDLGEPLTYRGTANLTQPAPQAAAGDLFISSTTGAISATWTGLTPNPGFTNAGERVVFDGTNWAIMPPEPGTGVQQVDVAAPITKTGGEDQPTIGITAATQTAPGSMSAADKLKLDNITDNARPGTVTSVGSGNGLTGGPITETGSLAVGQGTGITVNANDVAVNRTTVDTWYAPANHVGAGGTAHADATTSTAGFMSSADKTKLDGIPTGGGGGGTVTEVTGTAPIVVATTTTTPVVSINAATTGAAGSMSGADKSKLDGIAANAQVNVKSDWNASSGDAEILNKPSIPAAANDGQINFNAGDGLTSTGTNATANQSGNTSKTFAVQAANNTINVVSGGISVNTGNLGMMPTGGGTFTGGIYQTVRTIGNNTAWNMATGNLWTFAGGTIANPTNATAGCSGVIRVTGAIAGWGGNFDFPGGSAPTATTPAVFPYYVAANNVILIGNPTNSIT